MSNLINIIKMKNFTSTRLLLLAAGLAGAIPTVSAADYSNSAKEGADAPVAHAYQMGSKASKWGFVSFTAGNIDALTINKTTSSSDDQIGAGEYVDGKLYTYTLEYDFIYGDGLEPSEFVVWNASDYSKASYKSSTTKGRVVDMTYDYVHNTMYALVEEKRTSNGSIGLTALNVIDLESGEATLVGLPGDIRALNGIGKEVEEHLIALASDPTDGSLYAMGEYRQLYKLDRTTGLATAVGKRNKIAITNDFQSMAFDAEGKLYQVHMHPDYEYFMMIDKTTGALTNPVTGEAVTVNSDYTNNAARFTDDPQLTALYFEGHKFAAGSPEAVSALKAVTAENNPNSVCLTWTLPEKNHDGTAAVISGVDVYRFGTSEPIASLGADAVSYTDNNAPNGDVTYYVAAHSAEHAGFPAWTTVFAGADQLKAVADLKASLDGNVATISWTAPTATVNGGYADYDNITYIVKAVKGNEQTVLAEGVKTTSYETVLEANGTYQFSVVAVSCGIEGLETTSNTVTLVGVEQLPYFCGFEDNDGGTLWTIANTNTGSYGWSIVSGYAYQQLSGKFAQFKTGGSSTFPANDWLVSPAIHFPAGKAELSFYANGGSYDTHTYEVYLGPNSVAEYTQLLYRCENEKVYSQDGEKNYVLVTVEFNVEAILCAQLSQLLRHDVLEPPGVRPGAEKLLLQHVLHIQPKGCRQRTHIRPDNRQYLFRMYRRNQFGTIYPQHHEHGERCKNACGTSRTANAHHGGDHRRHHLRHRS